MSPSEAEDESRTGNFFDQYIYEKRDCILNVLYDTFYFAEARVLRIETKQAPRPSQPEVVLSDGMILYIYFLISLN